MNEGERTRACLPSPCNRKRRVHAGRTPMGRRLAAVLCAIGALLICRWGTAAEDAAPAAAPDGLITVQIPYDVFMTLARYQDLMDAEARGETVDREMVDVLEIMIDRLMNIRRRYAEARTPNDMKEELGRRLGKLDRHLDDFRKERAYRRKIAELREKLEEQRALMESP